MSFVFFKKLLSINSVYKNKSNEELMILVMQDDIEAFETLYERLKVSIYSYIFNLLKDKSESIEIAQEVFTSIYDKRKTYRREYKATTWIWTIARNKAIDKLRSKDAMNFKDINEVDDFEKEEDSIEFLIDKKIKRELVKKCFDNLSPSYQEALGLRIFSELSYEEISKSIDKSISSIKGLIFKAKKELSECVKRCLGKDHE